MTASWRNHQTGEALHNCPEEPPGKGDDFPEASSHEQVAANQTPQHPQNSSQQSHDRGVVRVDGIKEKPRASPRPRLLDT